MADARLAPNLPDWMVEHANRYLSSGGTDGHLYKMTQPGRPEITVPSLLLTTTGRRSGEKFIFPLFYGNTGDGYFVVASKGGAPAHPGWYRNILANPDVELQVGTQTLTARARTATGATASSISRQPRSSARAPVATAPDNPGWCSWRSRPGGSASVCAGSPRAAGCCSRTSTGRWRRTRRSKP